MASRTLYPVTGQIEKGTVLDYATKTTDSAITAISEATATALVTGVSIYFDGATAVEIEFYSPGHSHTATRDNMTLVVYDVSTARTGQYWVTRSRAANQTDEMGGVFARTRIIPTAGYHTYSIRAWVQSGTGTWKGTSNYPMYMKITVV